MKLLNCRVCKCGESMSLGQISDSDVFAGQAVNSSISGGELWLCRNCGSMFRHPTLSLDEYISLYEKLPATLWAGQEGNRNDFSLIYEYLKDHTGGDILDIGCYSGDFLAGLPDGFRKYGLEPSYMASQVAGSRGIEVLGKTLDELHSRALFDVIVAIDVIEHVLDVEEFVNQILPHLKDNGLLIISTGDPQCFAWKRVFKSKYWYCLFSEHLTFPSFRFFIDYSVRNGLCPPKRIRYRYLKLGVVERIAKVLKVLPVILPPFLYRALRRSYRFLKGDFHLNSPGPPTSLIGAFTDHHLVIIKNGGPVP